MTVAASCATELLVPSLRALEQLGREFAQRASESGLGILAAHGLAIASFSDIAERIPHATALALLDNAVRVSGDPAFALHAGRQVKRGDFGAYDLLADSAPTLGSSMQLAARYLPLLHDGAAIELVMQGDVAIWQHRLLPGVTPSAAANEYVVSCFYFGAAQGLGFVAPPLEVRFMHAAPAHRAAYGATFGAAVGFDAACNAMVLPRAALELPLATSDPPLLAVLTRHADELMQRLPHAQPFVQRVRAALREHLHLQQAPGLQALAEALHMSESSVQRHLQAAGTSYSELLDAVRRELSTELLADTDLNVSEIAYRLGFAHRPAFHRAFKRWHGCSPTEHRERSARSAFYRFYRPSRA